MITEKLDDILGDVWNSLWETCDELSIKERIIICNQLSKALKTYADTMKLLEDIDEGRK